MGKASKRRQAPGQSSAAGGSVRADLDQLEKIPTTTIKQYLDVFGVNYLDIASDRKELIKRLVKVRDDDRQKAEDERKRSASSWFNIILTIVCIRFLISMKPLSADLQSHVADVQSLAHHDWIVLDVAYNSKTGEAFIGVLNLWVPLTESQAALTRTNLVWWLNSIISILWLVCPTEWMETHFTVNWQQFRDGHVYTPILASFSNANFYSLLFYQVIINLVITGSLVNDASLSSVMVVYMLGGSLHSLFMAVSNEALMRKNGNFSGVGGALYACCAFQAVINPEAQFTFVGILSLTGAQLLVAMGLMDILELGDYNSLAALLHIMGHYTTVIVGVFMAVFLEGVPMFSALENFSRSLSIGWADWPPGGGAGGAGPPTG